MKVESADASLNTINQAISNKMIITGANQYFFRAKINRIMSFNTSIVLCYEKFNNQISNSKILFFYNFSMNRD